MIWFDVSMWILGGFLLALFHLLPSNRPRASDAILGGMIGALIGGVVARVLHWRPYEISGFSLTQLISALVLAEFILLVIRWTARRSGPARPAGLRS